MPKINHSHWDGGPPCDLPTKKECTERYQNWQADEWVALAQRVVRERRWEAFRKDKGIFPQLVLVMAGERETITNSDDVQTMNAWGARVIAAVERYRAAAATVETGGTLDAGDN